MNPLETYLSELATIRSSGAAVPETSYYPYLERLLTEVGGKLKPKVRCIINLANRGAGIPDGGLYTRDQLPEPSAEEPLKGTLPTRGAIEVKPASEDAWKIAASEQVRKYLSKYNQVLVTNLRDFVLAAEIDGKPVTLESFRLAQSEADFWGKAAHARKTAEEIGERFTDYLKRVILRPASLDDPAEVAWFLASYAREAKARIEGKTLEPLALIRSALEEALGMKFEGDEGENFFRATLVQTLFYGVFSAWVFWHKETASSGTKLSFEWQRSAEYLHVPILRTLFHQMTDPGQLKALGLPEVLDWTGEMLGRVDRAAFFSRFEQHHAVQYFYEPFLKAYDPDLRKRLGVWYTPPEIVKYMVERVDTVLRTELDLPDGLADPQVYVLDPCCGTGAYLVEVLERIAATLQGKGGGALTAQKVKQAAMERVFGFELLPAPYAVSHLQLGLTLQALGGPLAGDERAAIYLTNALTGWEPLKAPKFAFAELEAEREAASEVKREKPILVILGNPPYNAFAGVSPEQEQGLVEPYKAGLISKWKIKKFNLDDLYVRFFRLAERRIAEKTGRGVICYISNFSYLSDPSFVVARQRFLSEFDRCWIDCLNGDSRETGKLTPEGLPDPSVFSTELNHEGIRVGTAVGLMVRKSNGDKNAAVQFRQFWGVNKRSDLLDSLKAKDFDAQYEPATPTEANRFSFRPEKVAASYREWPKLIELSAGYPFNGPVERRANSLIVFSTDKAKLANLRPYLDPAVSDEKVRSLEPRFMNSSGEFDAKNARRKLAGSVSYSEENIARYPFKPFDIRLAYLDADIQPLFSRPSPELLRQRTAPNNWYVLSRDSADKDPEGPPFLFSRLVCDYDCISGHTRHFPLFIVPQSQHAKKAVKEFAATAAKPRTNLSASVRKYLSEFGSDPDEDSAAADLWMHVLAIGYSPAYLSENADGVRQDWPRVPLAESKEVLLKSAELGKALAALLNTEAAVQGVTSGTIRPELKTVAIVSRDGGGNLDPNSGDLDVSAGWGHAGKDNAVMPGTGDVRERDYTPDELKSIEQGAAALGIDPKLALRHLGARTCDIYLNNAAYWRNIPARVWEYRIGGHQVIKKWLSYRERELLGRPLTVAEVEEVQAMARRIAAIILMEPALDANYQAIKASAYTWPSSGK